MKQRSWDLLLEYIQRFNRAALEVSLVISKILVSTFSQGLAKGVFLVVGEKTIGQLQWPTERG